MKKVAVLLVTALVLGSCSLFQKPSMTQEEIDAMVARNAQLQEDLVNAQHALDLEKMKAAECAQVMAEMQKAEEEIAQGQFHVIAGSFKNPAYAEEYSATVKGMGGSGTIIPGPSYFNLVASSSHSSLREAISAMENARMGDSPEAWVYMQR